MILRKAAAAIRQNGPNEVGVKTIMAKAGLTPGGFYAHFESKDDLVAEAIAFMFDERRVTFHEAFEGRTTEEGLIAFIDNYLSERHLRNTASGCPLPLFAADVTRMDGKSRKSYVEGYRRLAGLIEDRLEEMGTASAMLLARSILSEMIGAVATARAAGDKKMAMEVLKASRESIRTRIHQAHV